MQTLELQNKLESLIDSNSVKSVLESMLGICNEKAEHIRSNWQDQKLAKVWDNAGDSILTAISKVAC